MRGVVARLTRTHESSEPKPWKMGDSTPEYIDGMLKAIVGIEIAITRIEGKAKLSQNREPRDRLNAADTLIVIRSSDDTTEVFMTTPRCMPCWTQPCSAMCLMSLKGSPFVRRPSFGAKAVAFTGTAVAPVACCAILPMVSRPV